MEDATEFTIELLALLASVRAEHGNNALVSIRVDDYGVIIRDVVSNKILYDADTLVEFTHRFLVP